MATNKNAIHGGRGARQKESDPGYFQTIFSRLLDIASDPDLGAVPLATYVVLAGGVDSAQGDSRASTHWVESVRRRTGMSAPEISLAIEALVKKGFVELPRDNTLDPAETGENFFKVKCRVDPGAVGKMSAMSQRFLAPPETKGRNKVGRKASLASLWKSIETKWWCGCHQAMLDALVVFFGLHEHQDFFQYAGVDPRIVCARFVRWAPGRLGGVQLESNLVDQAGWSLVNAVPNKKMEPPCVQFLDRTLGRIPSWDGAPTLVDRFHLAIWNLKNVGLLYRIHVLWNGDPTRHASGLTPKPHYTLYVHESWDPTMEQSLQADIHGTAAVTGTVTGSEILVDSRGKQSRPAGMDVYSYILPTAQLKDAVLLTQFRARWWATNKVTHDQFDGDHERLLQWRGRLKSVEKDFDPADVSGEGKYAYDEM